jgi:hypothetical protein
MAGFAMTRAFNRATAALIAPNELPAEEMTEVEDYKQFKRPNFTQFFKTISSYKTIDVKTAKQRFRKEYGKDIQHATSEELEQFKSSLHNEETKQVFEDTGGF